MPAIADDRLVDAQPVTDQQPQDGRRRERELVAGLRRGDEAAFVELVELHHDALMRTARTFVRSRAAAEDVVQDTWAGALSSLPRFEGRSSLRTWLYRILAHQAIDHVRREGRSLPFAALPAHGRDGAEALAERLAVAPGAAWTARPVDGRPEERLLIAEQRDDVERAIASLTHRQRLVITLRDVQGWSAGEAAQALGISVANQRVLLHRARLGVRAALVGTDSAAYPPPGRPSARSAGARPVRAVA